jgi:hypothetical protein
MHPLFPEYLALWQRIQADGIHVRYGGSMRGEDGYFDHVLVPIDLPGGEEGWGPVIVICRPGYTMPADVPSDRRKDGELWCWQRERLELQPVEDPFAR